MTAYLQPERTHRTPWFGVVAFALAVILGAGITAADASSLGGITSRTMSASRQLKAAQVPTVIAWENFDGPNNTNLSGRTTTGGNRTWSVMGGTWNLQNNTADAPTAYNVAALINAGTSAAAAEATINRGGTTFDLGVVTNMNATGTQFLTAELLSTGSGEVQVWKYDNGWTLLAQVSNLYTGPASTWPTTTTIRMSSSATGVLTVSLGGTVISTVTLSAADRTLFQNSSHQRFGLFAYYDGVSTWDDFHLDSA